MALALNWVCCEMFAQSCNSARSMDALGFENHLRDINIDPRQNVLLPGQVDIVCTILSMVVAARFGSDCRTYSVAVHPLTVQRYKLQGYCYYRARSDSL